MNPYDGLSVLHGVKKIIVRFKQGDFKGYITMNKKGKEIGYKLLRELEPENWDRDEIESFEENPIKLSYDEQPSRYSLVLEDNNKNELFIDSLNGYELAKLIVAVEIVD